MKKLMFAVAAVAAGTVLADVTSQNIVGYNATALNKGKGQFTTVTIPFLKISESNKGFSLNDLGLTNLKFGNSKDLADNIWIWSGIGWQVFYYRRYGSSPNFTYKWMLHGGTASDDFDHVYEDGLPEGASLYVKANDANEKTLTGSGEVESKPQVGFPLVDNAQFAFVGNPYPTRLDITNSEQFEFANVSFGNSKDLSDNIWIWSGIGWQVFYYRRYGSSPNYTYKWMLHGGTASDDFSRVYEDGLPVGSALYIKTKRNSTLTTKEAVFKKNF